jgi:hypothetical protein
MSNITEVADAIFSKDLGKWLNISDDDKNKFGFIFNRHLSKKYINYSNSLNHKSQDFISLMNMWFYFIKNHNYENKWDISKWFWSKSPKFDKVDDSNYQKLMIKFEIDKKEDLQYLMDKYPDIVESELKLIKKNDRKG